MVIGNGFQLTETRAVTINYLGRTTAAGCFRVNISTAQLNFSDTGVNVNHTRIPASAVEGIQKKKTNKIVKKT